MIYLNAQTLIKEQGKLAQKQIDITKTIQFRRFSCKSAKKMRKDKQDIGISSGGRCRKEGNVGVREEEFDVRIIRNAVDIVCWDSE